MELPDLSDFARLPWPTWAALVVGVIASGLTLLVGGRLIRDHHRRRPAAVRADQNHDPFLYGSTTEKRATVRRKGHSVDVLVSDAEVKQEPVRGWVVDRSVGGLCLMLPSPAAEGSVLTVKPRAAPAGMPWVRVTVRSCIQQGDSYAVGVEFERTPTWNILLLFG